MTMNMVIDETRSEEPPGTEIRLPFPWEDIPIARWADWRWQMTHRLSSVEDFASFMDLTPQERIGLSAPGAFRVGVTPYFASLMDPHDPNCPIRRQVLPISLELVPFDAELADSLGEDAHSPVPGLVHR
ncbi:MAG: lysine 2,3-aminomutase, partial [Anaerolineae bacterium]